MQEHWRRVGSRAAARQNRGREDLAWFHPFFPSSPTVTCKTPKKRSKQLILVFFLSCSWICLLPFGSAFLLVSPSSLFQAAGWRMGFCRRLCSCWWPVRVCWERGTASVRGWRDAATKEEENEGVSLWFWPVCGGVLKWQRRVVDAPVMWVWEAVWRRKGERSTGWGAGLFFTSSGAREKWSGRGMLMWVWRQWRGVAIGEIEGRMCGCDGFREKGRWGCCAAGWRLRGNGRAKICLTGWERREVCLPGCWKNGVGRRLV